MKKACGAFSSIAMSRQFSVKVDSDPQRVVIVTGGAKGIGRAICEKFADDSAAVMAIDRDTIAGLELERKYQDRSAGFVRFIEADLADSETCRNTITQISDEYGGRVDVLCNNVGIQTSENSKPVHLLEEDLWEEVLKVNLTSYFLMAKYILPLMKENGGGTIINMASV